MMWLGRMELYLDHPDNHPDSYQYTDVRATVHRQIVDAALIHELFTNLHLSLMCHTHALTVVLLVCSEPMFKGC